MPSVSLILAIAASQLKIRSGAWPWLAALYIHRRQKFYRDAKFIAGQILHANHLGHIFANHWIVRRTERKRHENPHSLVIARLPRREINSFFRRIHAGRNILKMFVLWAGRADADRPRNLCASAAPVIGDFSFTVTIHYVCVKM